jgi:hypothetical protein
MSDKNIVKNDHEVEIMSEAEGAATNMASIQTHPTNVSRSDLIAKMVAYASKADIGDLSDFISRVGVAEYMPGQTTPAERFDSVKAAANATGDQSEKNKATIKSSGKEKNPMQGEPVASLHPAMLARESVQNDLALLFGDSDDLSEDFRLKVSTLFEAAVSTRVNMETVKLEEEYDTLHNELAEQYETTLEESILEIKNEMVENIDNYLNYAVAEWVAENKLAIKNNIRTEMAESFLANLKQVFEDHYVDIPEKQIDVVEAMAEELEQVKAHLNDTTEKNIELTKIVNQKNVADLVNSMSEGMTDTQKDKFLKLTEAVSYNDADEFRKKISIIKETYFPKNQEVKVAKDQLLSETVEEPLKTLSTIDPNMQNYVSSISRILKK